MRIAHVTDAIDGVAGGVQRHVLDLSITQQAHGDSPIAIVPESGVFSAACDEYGVPVAVESRIDDLRSLFKDLGVDVIHCHTTGSAMTGIPAGNSIGIPCVYTQHVQRLFVFQRPDLKFTAIVVCRSVFERLKKDGFPEGRLYYIPHGTKVMPRVTSRPSRPSLISVGRLEQVKGFDIAILAMAELRRRHGLDYCPVLNIYGGGSWGEYLQEMVSVLCLDDRIRLHGAQSGILERCPTTDILIVSSRAESGPLVALEAMSRGMPIVATRVGEIEQMIPDQRYGYIARDETITALADAIESMLSDVHAGRFDPDLPISRHRELYTLEKMAERVDAVYKSLTTRNAPVG